MANTTHNLTRRETLAGIGIVAATAAAPISAVAAVSGDTAAWDEAMRRFEHCDAAVNAYSKHYDRAEAQYLRAIKALPHKTVTFPSGREVSTANSLAVTGAKQAAEKVVFLERCAYDDHRASMALYDAFNAREAEKRAIDARTGYSVTNDHYEALVERLVDARDVLMAMPAPNLKALLWKLEYFMEDTAYEAAFVEQPIADMRRLLGA